MRRRQFIKTASLGFAGTLLGSAFGSVFQSAFAAAAQTGAAPARFKITDLRTVKLRMVKDFGTMDQVSANPPLRYRTMTGGNAFTEVHTDQGLIGIGPGVDDESLAFAK